MKTINRTTLLSLAVSACLTACIVIPVPPKPLTPQQRAQEKNTEVDVRDTTFSTVPPPPAVEQVLPPAPAADAVWMNSYWRWTGVRYEWMPGHWVHPRPGYAWQTRRWLPAPEGGWNLIGGWVEL